MWLYCGSGLWNWKPRAEVPWSALTLAGDWVGSGRAQGLVFDLTSLRLKDDASSLLLTLPESSLQEICGPYCTQEQNTSLSFYQRRAAHSHRQKSSITHRILDSVSRQRKLDSQHRKGIKILAMSIIYCHSNAA